jgi:glycosyltransferase involved in cell wall biosynthesis
MAPPRSASNHVIPVRFREPNDASPWQMMRYERRQRAMVNDLLRSGQFDLVHRVTPSGIKGSLLLPPPPLPHVLGPILFSGPHPPSFDEFFRPQLPREKSIRATIRRLQNGIARRAFDSQSTLNALIDSAAAILVGSPTTLKQLTPRVHPRCREITYAGVENHIFHPPKNKRTNRVPTLIFVGRLMPYKGPELLLRAAAIALRSCRFALKFVGAGESTYRKYCEQLAQSLGLSSNVEFLDGRPRASLAEFYRSADVFCMPSIETYGLAILEAMSSGCAVVVSDINGPGDIVQPGTGVKVPLQSPDQFLSELAARIVELLENAPLRHDLGDAARDHVIRHHDWKQIQSRLLEICEQTFNQRPPASPKTLPAVTASPR